MSYLFFSNNLAKFLVKKTNVSNDKEEILAYAVEVLSLNLLNVGMSLLIGYIVGVLPGTIICLLTVFAIRMFAGGAHSESAWRCAIITAVIFPFIALLAHRGAFLITSADPFLTLAFAVGFSVLFFKAPVDSQKAPIISKTRHNNLKKLSLFSLTVVYIAAEMSRHFVTDSVEWQLCIMFGILWSSFLLTPIGHKLFTAFDSLRIHKKRRCNL